MSHQFVEGGRVLRHDHMLIRFWCQKPPRDVEKIKKWIKELIQSIDMVLVAGPVAHYVDELGNKGLTASACIATSHIAIHVWDEPYPAMCDLDVYTCSTLRIEDVLKKIKEFEPTTIQWKLLDRENGFQDVGGGVISGRL